jgi:hypothetical protein
MSVEMNLIIVVEGLLYDASDSLPILFASLSLSGLLVTAFYHTLIPEYNRVLD